MSEPDWSVEARELIDVMESMRTGAAEAHLEQALRNAYARGYRDGMEDSAKYVEGCELRYRVGHYEALPELRPLAQALRTLARLPVGEAIRALMDKGGGEP